MAFNVSVSNQKTDTTSMLALANVEALAQSEGGEEDDPGFITVPYTKQCSLPGEEMWGGLAIGCIPGGPDESCETFDPCNI